jgi:hypothetical protein
LATNAAREFFKHDNCSFDYILECAKNTVLMNSKKSPTATLFRKLSHLIGHHPTELRRRDLRCARESEIQLELDLPAIRHGEQRSHDLAVIR